MPAVDRTIPRERSIPLAGVLAFIGGCCLLFLQWKFSRLARSWSGFHQILYALGALILMTWGAFRLLVSLAPGSQRNRVPLLNRHRVAASREGLVCLVMFILMFIGAMLGRSNMLLLVSSMMAGPFVLNGWISFMMLKRTKIRRRVPERAMAGEPISVEIVLENQKKWLSSWLMAVSNEIENAHERLNAGLLFVRVPPGEKRSAQFQLELLQRGTYSLGPVYVSTRFPLGLGERGLVFNTSDTILVYPRLGRLTSKWRREQATAEELVQRRQTRRGVFEDEFHRIREYRWDDNPRAIHWRTSARRNELMVREFHQSRDQDLIVLLDLWLPTRPTGADFDRVELAVSFAATVCVDFLKKSRESELCMLTCGKSVSRWRGPAGAAAIEPVLERLAVVEAGISPDVEQLFDRWLAERSSVARTVLVTTRHRDEHGFAELIGSNSETNRPTSHVQVFEASQRELQPFFQLS